MNYFAGRRLNTTGHVIAVETAATDGRMDCEDCSRVRVWLVVPIWSDRRALLTDGEPFFAALMRNPHPDDPGLSDEAIERTLATTSMRESWVRLLIGQYFRVDFTAPDDEAEAAERIEFHSIVPMPPYEEVCARLGITP
jgi:hypothetical protein